MKLRSGVDFFVNVHKRRLDNLLYQKKKKEEELNQLDYQIKKAREDLQNWRKKHKK